MTFPKARLAVSALLFFSWLGFLGYLVLNSSKIILSRPQFLIASLYVVAEISAESNHDTLNQDVTIEEVLWAARPDDMDLVRKQIVLPEIVALGKKQGNQGPGKYLLPLQRTDTGGFEIAPVPHTLNFATTPATHATLESFGLFSHHLQRRLSMVEALERQKERKAAGQIVYLTPEEIRIYPWTSGTRTQVQELIRAK